MHKYAQEIYSDVWEVLSPNRQSDKYILTIKSKRINVKPTAEEQGEAIALARKLLVDAKWEHAGESINGNYLMFFEGTGYTDLAYLREGVTPFDMLKPGVYIGTHISDAASAVIFKKDHQGNWSSTAACTSVGFNNVQEWVRHIYDTKGLQKLEIVNDED